MKVSSGFRLIRSNSFILETEAQKRKRLGFKCQYPKASQLQANQASKPFKDMLFVADFFHANNFTLLLKEKAFSSLLGPGQLKDNEVILHQHPALLTTAPSSSF